MRRVGCSRAIAPDNHRSPPGSDAPFFPSPVLTLPVLATQLLAAEPSADYATAPTPFIEVLVDCPGADKLFVYGIPEDLEVEVGDILSVPFGAQQVGAIAVRFVTDMQLEVHRSRVKPIEDVITRGLFPATYWQLIDRVATYYGAPLMQTIRTALPPGLLQKSQRRLRLNRDRLPPKDGAASQPQLTAQLSPPAQQILQVFATGKSESYTDRYLRQKVRGAGRAIRELRRWGWLDSYLEAPQANRPQSRPAIVLTGGDRSELTPRQQELLTILERSGGELWLTDFLQQARTSRGTVTKLETAGCVTLADREVLRQESSPMPPRDSLKALTADQAVALEHLTAVRDFHSFLLHGVTGSGKTEVYLQTIAPVIDRGQSALVLVPEIGLTPQLTDRFRARFGDRVRVYHSGLSSGERFDTWRQMLTGEPQVVIGTRSAVFAPLPDLGMIILDEEHDSSFKQDQPAPTYHARTVAIWRAQLENCPIVLGSATPSLETWINHVGETSSLPGLGDRDQTTNPNFAPNSAPNSAPKSATYLSLPRRVRDRPMPTVRVVDLRNELQLGNRSIFSRPLQQALRDLKTTGKQGILFIHRRGHSSFVSCRSCGEVMECPRCDVSLSYHHAHDRATPTLRCHYCNHQQLQPSHCPSCGSPYLKFFGSGTQRVMRELERLLPELRAIRFDSDTTRRKGAHRAAIARFAAGEADVLVGTQMLTKGLDLPSVSLVGIVAADGLLGMSHYWAAERAFQTLTQVAGRAGRGDDRGQAILQTYQPEHPVVRAAMRHDYFAFLPEELATRRELGYPPFGRLAIVRVSGVDGVAVQAWIEQVAKVLAAELGITRTLEVVGNPIALANHVMDVRVQLLGPSPAPIERIADRTRWQILLKFPREATIALSLERLRAIVPSSLSVELDIDPLQLG